MPDSQSNIRRVAAACVGLMLAAWVLGAPAQEPTDDVIAADPFPIQRVLLPRDRLNAELERVRQGTLIRLTRADFEKRVRAAAKAAEQPARPPLLAASSYRAKLGEADLAENSLVGTAEWKFAHAGPRPALFSLEAFQLALKQARWTDNRAAIIGVLGPAVNDGMALLVDEVGDSSLALDWSSRGVPEQGAVRFDLAVPACASAILDLELPARFKPFFPQDDVVVLQSPDADDAGETRSWRVGFGGLTHLEIVVRPTGMEGQPRPLVEATQNSRQEIQPTSAVCESTFEFRTLQGEIGELLIDCDPEATIVDVAVPNLRKWSVSKAPVNGRKRLRVQLSEPTAGDKLIVSASVPVALAQWSSPSFQMVGAIPRGEKLRLRLSPDLKLLEWKPGTFMLLASEFRTDRVQVLWLESGLLAEGQTAPVRPSARFKLRDVEFRTRQHLEWKIDGDRATLTTWLNVDVMQGTLPTLTLRTPVGWEVERVDGNVREPGLTWTPAAGQVLVEFAKPLAAGTSAEVTLRLSNPLPKLGKDGKATLAFPDIVPVGAFPRSGEYTVRVGPAFQARAPVPLRAEEIVGPLLAAEATSSSRFTYPYYGQPPTGPLTLSANAFTVPAGLGGGGPRKRAEEPPPKPVAIESTGMTIAVQPDGSFRCLYRLRVRDSDGQPLAVRLPADSTLLDVALDGRTLGAEQYGSLDAGTLNIPLPGSSLPVAIELLFTRPGTPIGWTLRLPNPLPADHVGPFPTVTWRLPPGFVPVDTGRFVRLPGGPAVDRIGWPSLPSLTTPSGDFRERTTVEIAGKQAVSPKGDPRSLLQFLATSSGMPEKPIIDTTALAELDLDTGTPVSGNDLDALGLVVAVTPSGQVLTSARQLSLWKVNGDANRELPPSIRSAVDDAARFGRDQSGRFRTVDDWMTLSDTTVALMNQLGGDGPGWTAWHERPGDREVPPRVADARRFSVAGWVGGMLLFGLGLLLGRNGGRVILLIALVLLLLVGSLLTTLPAAYAGSAVGPFVALVGLVLLSICRKRRTPSAARTVVAPRSGRSRLQPSLPVAILLILSLALSAHAWADNAATVYLLPATGKEDEPKAVLIAPDVLERLTLLEHPRLALVDAAILRARYTGSAQTGQAAEFDARFDVVAFADKAMIALPLGDVRLREVLLDGAAAFPKPLGNDRVSIDVAGKGAHRIDVKFTVPVAVGNPDREVKFATPDVAICQLEFRAPPGSSHVRAVNWRGAQTHTDAGRVLHADLGRTRQMHLRFREGGSDAAPLVRVLEAAIWDVGPLSATLRAGFDFRISQGSVSSLAVLMPAGVAVSRVDVRPETSPIGSPPLWVRDWNMGANRVLNIELQGVLSGNVRVYVDAIPLKTLGLRPTLEFPSAMNVTEAEHYAGYRLESFETVDEVERKGAADTAAETFMTGVWKPLAVERTSLPVTRVFKGNKAEPIVLRPVLRPTPFAGKSSQELTWEVGPLQADVQAAMHWTPGPTPLSFVEFDVPAAVKVHDVRGLALHSWLRNGNQVIAWLREPTAAPSLYWRGTLPRGGAGTEAAPFEPPLIRMLGTRATATTLRLRTPPGWIAQLDNPSTAVTVIPGKQEGEIAIALARPSTPVRLLLRLPQSNATFSMTSSVQVIDGKLTMETLIEPMLRRDRPHRFTIAVAAGEGWRIDEPSGPNIRVKPIDPKEWEIDVLPRERDALPIRLAFAYALTGMQILELPTVAIRIGSSPVDVARQHHTSGREVRTLPTAPGSVQAAPMALDDIPAVRVLMADVRVAAVNGGWVYRASLDVRHESDAMLDITLPSDATWLAIGVDDELLPVPSGLKQQVRLEGVSTLHLVWSSPARSLELPKLESRGRVIDVGQVLWTAIAAPGDRFEGGSTCSPAMHYLLRAETLLKQPGNDQRIGRLLRLADVNLNTPRGIARQDEQSPAGLPMTDWLNKLREQFNGGRVKGAPPPESRPAKILDQLPFADAFHQGKPIRWIGKQDVHIHPPEAWSSLPALATFTLLALGVAVLALLTLTFDRATRPEQAALLGLIGFAALGPPAGVPFLGITAVAVVVRGASVLRRLTRLSSGVA